MPDDQPSQDTSHLKRHQSSIVLAALAGVAICLLAGWQFKPADPVIPQKMGKVVYAIKGVQEGQVIGSEALEEKEIPLSDIPPYAASAASLVKGRYAKVSMVKGHLILMDEYACP